jgi:isocitrate/isopropylmalate dehydrogenase
MKTYRIAVIAGDGIGTEVVPEGIRVLEAAADKFGFKLDWHSFDWSCQYYKRTGMMMPADGIEQLSPFDGIFLGAVGQPGVPDHISLVGTTDSHQEELSSICESSPSAALCRHRNSLEELETWGHRFLRGS